MDLRQTKLTKAEWINVEIPVIDEEKRILQLIIDGYHNVNIHRNDTLSLIQVMKLESTPEMEQQLYKQYFEKKIQDIRTRYQKQFQKIHATDPLETAKPGKTKPLKTKDLIRMQSMDSKIDSQRPYIFEFVLLDFVQEMFDAYAKGSSRYAFYLYTLLQLKKSTILHIHPTVHSFVYSAVNAMAQYVEMKDVLRQSYEFIEKNPHLLKYEDRTLYQHQKQLFSLFRQNPIQPQLVLYTAPTGTGKTLSPLGLSEGHRIIFICAARHVGLALAKSAVSVGKRIAVAFGCETASDVRLHYFAAADYQRNKRTGGIGRVDNSNGCKVQLMICDVQSYLVAMHYMLAFSPRDEEADAVAVANEQPLPPASDADLITYWDEPTISMDYTEHPLHEKIQENWKQNLISKVVLSCATLPTEDEINDVLQDFRCRFDGTTIHTITSYDCRKSISLLNKSGNVVIPHLLYREYDVLQKCVQYCQENKTLLRYFDLSEIVRFIEILQNLPESIPEEYSAANYFADGIGSITMNQLKLYYLELLSRVNPAMWESIFDELASTQQPKFAKKTISKMRSMNATTSSTIAGGNLVRSQSMCHTPIQPQDTKTTPPASYTAASTGILLTTEDAHTLTDGPTIFLCDDVEKIGKFYIQQSKIPDRVFQLVSDKILQNSSVQEKMDELGRLIDDKKNASTNKEQTNIDEKDQKNMKKRGGKSERADKEPMNGELAYLTDQVDHLRSQIRMVVLDNAYIPNTIQHQTLWVSQNEDQLVKNAFVPTVDEESVRDIMSLDVTNEMKLLLLIGIGMFKNHDAVHPRYMEIMKRLAYNQQLFLILASSDYIYGTNYQFCHGLIGKDLTNMTQQKTIQAMGRIGRNAMQQEYSVRFREDEMLLQLFQKPAQNREAETMCRLFSSDS